MFETVAWISIIIGFVVVISFSLAAMLLTRRREQNAPRPASHEEAVGKVDSAADAALNEINKTAGLIIEDINEKYQTLLFLYDLIEEKMKTIEALKLIERSGVENTVSEPKIAPLKVITELKAKEDIPSRVDIVITAEDGLKEEKPKRKAAVFNAKHEKIVDLFKEGMHPAEIAKELDIGRGEVKLVLDLAQIG